MRRIALLLGVALSLLTTSIVAQNCAGFSDVPAATIRAQQREIADLSERVQKAESMAADVVALKAALAELQRGRETVAVK